MQGLDSVSNPPSEKGRNRVNDKIKKLLDKNIYNYNTILKCYKLSEKVPFGEMIFFEIENSNDIKHVTIIKREDFENYQPKENEYYLSRLRDTGWVGEDYILQLVPILKNEWGFKF